MTRPFFIIILPLVFRSLAHTPSGPPWCSVQASLIMLQRKHTRTPCHLQVLKAVSAGERLILLDERGRDASSEDFARLLIKASDDGTPLCFCIGGPFGHGDAVRQRAQDQIRFSRCVLNHSVAYLVLAEQLYRAWTIVKGEPYHH